MTHCRYHTCTSASDIVDSVDEYYALTLQDVIGIDLEWKPDNAQEENNVALMQLASQTVVLLIRTCKIGVPKKLINFLRYLVAFSAKCCRYQAEQSLDSCY